MSAAALARTPLHAVHAALVARGALSGAYRNWRLSFMGCDIAFAWPRAPLPYPLVLQYHSNTFHAAVGELMPAPGMGS